MGEEYKNQHIAPRSYLKRFALERKKETYIMGVRLQPKQYESPKFFPASVDDVAYKKNYYDTLEKKDKKFWEHYIDKNFDTLCGTPLQNIIAKITLSMPNQKVLSESDKDVLSRIILSQAIRVPAFLEERISFSKKQLQEYKKETIDKLHINSANIIEAINNMELTDDSGKNIVLESLFDEEHFNKFCSILKSKTWIVYYNGIRNQIPFITCDNPVMFFEIGNEKHHLSKIGLLSDKLVILFPLSPSILIGIYSPNIYFGHLNKFDSLVKVIEETNFIIKINCTLISQSYRHSFFPHPIYETTAINKKQ